MTTSDAFQHRALEVYEIEEKIEGFSGYFVRSIPLLFLGLISQDMEAGAIRRTSLNVVNKSTKSELCRFDGIEYQEHLDAQRLKLENDLHNLSIDEFRRKYANHL
jgi:hypothetical protein